jgi:hypothetical protein
MPKRVYIALAFLLVVLAGVIGWQVLRLREPVYQGRRLSVWLEMATRQRMSGNPYDREVEAIRHIGTNALPVLIAMLRAHDMRLKQVIMTWAQKQKLVHFNFRSADQRREDAFTGYVALGSLASVQIPNLMDCLTNDPSPNVRMAAASALGQIGPDARVAAPALFRAAKDTNETVRIHAYWVLGQILPGAQLAVPVLVAGLADPYQAARDQAALVLGKYGPEARAAVPALLRTLTTNRYAFLTTNRYAGSALKKIDPEAAAKAGVE